MTMLLLWLACTADKIADTDTETDTGAEAALGYTSLDALLEPIRAEHGLPSLAGAVVAGEALTHLGAVGVRSLDSDTPVTHADRYHLGSCTKAMTATLAAVLVEDGVLGWQTTMAEAFPDLALHPDYEAVTIEMLLAHVGGAWSSPPQDVWAALWEDGDVVAQRAWFAEQALTVAPEVTPGSAWRYSNSGYILVGAAMEAATGSSWEALMQAHLLDPLGMASCGFGPPDPGGERSQPWGHSAAGRPVDGAGRYADNPPALGPAGTVHCSLEDWGRFASAHLAGARGESTWLRTESFTKMHTPVQSDYALGWGVASRDWGGDAPVLSHSGSNTMFYSVIWLAPDHNTAFLAATNQGEAASALDTVIGELIAL